MNDTGLKYFPPSVGRLCKLEVLSLNGNELSELPVTLGFCKQLKVLNLQKNQFTRLPSVILHLEKLEDLRRLDNPLPPRWNGFASFPHLTTSKSMPKTDEQKVVYNSDSLQMLCTKAIFTSHIDYWRLDSVGPLQCKMLDHLAKEFAICENCHSVVHKQGMLSMRLYPDGNITLANYLYKYICSTHYCMQVT